MEKLTHPMGDPKPLAFWTIFSTDHRITDFYEKKTFTSTSRNVPTKSPGVNNQPLPTSNQNHPFKKKFPGSNKNKTSIIWGQNSPLPQFFVANELLGLVLLKNCNPTHHPKMPCRDLLVEQKPVFFSNKNTRPQNPWRVVTNGNRHHQDNIMSARYPKDFTWQVEKNSWWDERSTLTLNNAVCCLIFYGEKTPNSTYCWATSICSTKTH